MVSEYLKILDIQLREVGAKRRLNGTSKVNTQTDKHTDGHFDLQKASAQRADALKNISLQQKYERDQFCPTFLPHV